MQEECGIGSAAAAAAPPYDADATGNARGGDTPLRPAMFVPHARAAMPPPARVCIKCALGRRACTGARPCARCVRLGQAHECIDAPLNYKRYLREGGVPALRAAAAREHAAAATVTAATAAVYYAAAGREAPHASEPRADVTSAAHCGAYHASARPPATPTSPRDIAPLSRFGEHTPPLTPVYAPPPCTVFAAAGAPATAMPPRTTRSPPTHSSTSAAVLGTPDSAEWGWAERPARRARVREDAGGVEELAEAPLPTALPAARIETHGWWLPREACTPIAYLHAPPRWAADDAFLHSVLGRGMEPRMFARFWSTTPPPEAVHNPGYLDAHAHLPTSFADAIRAGVVLTPDDILRAMFGVRCEVSDESGRTSHRYFVAPQDSAFVNACAEAAIMASSVPAARIVYAPDKRVPTSFCVNTALCDLMGASASEIVASVFEGRSLVPMRHPLYLFFYTLTLMESPLRRDTQVVHCGRNARRLQAGGVSSGAPHEALKFHALESTNIIRFHYSPTGAMYSATLYFTRVKFLHSQLLCDLDRPRVAKMLVGLASGFFPAVKRIMALADTPSLKDAFVWAPTVQRPAMRVRICDVLPSVLPPCGARTAGFCADAVTDASSVQLSPLSALSVAPSATAHSLATCEEDGNSFALSPRMLPAAAFGTDRDCGSTHMPAPQPPLQQRARTESLRTIATADASPEPTPWTKRERTASAFQDALAQLMPQDTPAELHACVPRGDQLLNLGRSLPQSLAPVVPYAHGSVVVDGEVVHSEVHEDSAHVWIGRVNMQARVFTAVARALQHSMRSATTCERGVGKSSPAPLSCKPQLQAYTTYLRYTCTCCGLHSFICDDASADAVAAFADNPVVATHDTAAAAHAFLARMMLPSGCPTSAGHSAFTTSAIVDPIGMEASELPVVTLHWFLAEQHAC